CGYCQGRQSCGAEAPNVCGCVPGTCAQMGLDCGVVPDGCGGQVDCGGCGAGTNCGGAGLANICGAPPAGANAMCSDDGWCRVGPSAHLNPVLAVVALAPGDALVSTSGGVVHRWRSGRLESTPAGLSEALVALWAAAPDDVWGI